MGAQKINNNAKQSVYGIVTDGNLWQFGKLYVDLFTKNKKNYTMDNMQELYGALECVVNLVEQGQNNS